MNFLFALLLLLPAFASATDLGVPVLLVVTSDEDDEYGYLVDSFTTSHDGPNALAGFEAGAGKLFKYDKEKKKLVAL
jgi:hypothetical protein